MPALARGDKAFPVRDRQIDRRQRPGAEDRARDDDAGGGLLMDHQIGADREHRRLQHHAQHLGDRAEAAGDVAGALIARQIVLVGLAPAPGQPAGHAHRDQHFGVAPAGGGEVVAPRRQRHRLLGRRARQELGDQRQRHQDDGADQRGERRSASGTRSRSPR